MPGLFGTLGSRLGGWGRKAVEWLQQIGGTVRQVFHLAEVAGVEIEPAAQVHEWGQVAISGDRAKKFAMIPREGTPPADWYEISHIPWDKPICYTVAAYGRDRATGRFAHNEYWITVSRPLTVGEILDEANARLGMEGTSPTMDIKSIALVGGSRREGEEWRW